MCFNAIFNVLELVSRENEGIPFDTARQHFLSTCNNTSEISIQNVDVFTSNHSQSRLI